MDVGRITVEAVRDALRDIRYAHPLTGNPLLQLDAVTVQLRDEGIADSARTREWMLGRLLDRLIQASLAALRPAPCSSAVGGEATTPAAELGQVCEDFRPGSGALEAWSVMCYRYLASSPLQMQEMADALGAGYRTLARRLNQGHELLTAALQEAELVAGREVGLARGAPVSHRVVADPNAEPMETSATMAGILSAVRDDARIVRVAPERLAEIGRRAVADLVEYRLGRVAEWSQERFALDERFVELTLLVDQGEDAAAGRWGARDKRYPSVKDVLADVDDPAVVLLGPPGCGKSTLLRRLELDTAVEGLREVTGTVTFFVPLNTYRAETVTDSPPPPGPWLSEQWAGRFPTLPPLDDLLAEARMVLLLDAVNEMPHRGSADYRERILGWKQYLHDLVARHPGNRVLFSCRSLDYSAPLSTPALRVPQVKIEPMGDEQVMRFLELYAPDRAKVLWGDLADTPQLDLLRSPYFLRLLVEEVETTGQFETGRAALFTGFVRRALKREIERDNRLFQPDHLVAERDYERMVTATRWRDPHELPERGQLFPRLAALAYGMQETRTAGEVAQVRVGYDEAVELLADDRAADILRAGAELGVLDEDRDRDEVLYRHQLVQEYFAARRLAAEPEKAASLVAHSWRSAEVSPTVDEVIDSLAAADPLPMLPQTGWEETTLLAAAMTGDAAAFVRGLIEANLSLAGRIAAQGEVRGRLPEALLDELRWALVHRSRDPEGDLRERIVCGHAVGDLGDPRYERRTGPHGEYLWPPMIELRGGVYPIGDDEPIEWTLARTGESGTETDQMPRHEVAIAAFRIGQFAVTNAEWAWFMASGGYDDERWWDTVDAKRWQRGELVKEGAKYNNRLWRRRFRNNPALFDRMVQERLFPSEAAFERWRDWMALDDEGFERVLETTWQPKRRTTPTFWTDEHYNRPSQPVVGVCWYEARAYCNWLAAQTAVAIRLPTEVEWEAAARGREARTYPWGEAVDRLKANTYETHVRRTTPVGVFPHGDTPQGVADLGGNTEDWTSSLLGESTTGEAEVTYRYPYDATDGREDPEALLAVARVMRGGSWLYDLAYARTACRYHSRPDSTDYSHGLRLVLSPLA